MSPRAKYSLATPPVTFSAASTASPKTVGTITLVRCKHWREKRFGAEPVHELCSWRKKTTNTPLGFALSLMGRAGVRVRGTTNEAPMPTFPTILCELDSPAAVATLEFQAMRDWYQFAPHARSRTQTVVLTQ